MRCPRGSSRPRPGLEDNKTGYLSYKIFIHGNISYAYVPIHFSGEKTGIKNTDADAKYDIIRNAATINISW